MSNTKKQEITIMEIKYYFKALILKKYTCKLD